MTVSDCLKGLTKLLEAISLAHTLAVDSGAPTERMSLVSMLLWDQQVAANRAGTTPDFPTLSTLKSGRRPRGHSPTITQIWDLAPDNTAVSVEGGHNDSRIELSVGSVSQASFSKRRRIEQLSPTWQPSPYRPPTIPHQDSAR